MIQQLAATQNGARAARQAGRQSGISQRSASDPRPVSGSGIGITAPDFSAVFTLLDSLCDLSEVGYCMTKALELLTDTLTRLDHEIGQPTRSDDSLVLPPRNSVFSLVFCDVADQLAMQYAPEVFQSTNEV